MCVVTKLCMSQKKLVLLYIHQFKTDSLDLVQQFVCVRRKNYFGNYVFLCIVFISQQVKHARAPQSLMLGTHSKLLRSENFRCSKWEGAYLGAGPTPPPPPPPPPPTHTHSKSSSYAYDRGRDK